jgi:oxaloacetate decarboxylase gamma subunit
MACFNDRFTYNRMLLRSADRAERGEMTGSLLQQGLTLMGLGMGTVFVFLTALVLSMTLMSRLVAAVTRLRPADDGGVTAAEVAAIAVALKRHCGPQNDRQ